MEVKLTDNFMKSLKGFDRVVISRIFLRLERLKNGNFGDFKKLSNGISELRFSFGVRVYYAEIEKDVLILVLTAGKKNTKKEQSSDIEKAAAILRKELGQ